MISCTEFIPAYSELFKYLEKIGRKPELIKFWEYLSDNFLANLKSLVEQQDAAYQDKLRGVLPEDRWMRFDEQLSVEVSDVQHRIRELRDEREPKWEDLKTTFERLEQGPELYRGSGHAFRAQQLAAVAFELVVTAGI